MENLTKFKLNRRRWAVQLALTTGLALLFIAALLWGLRGVTPAHADPGTLYVDGTIGSDTTDCTNPTAPCETIGYALTQAGNGDEICVAEGTYTETLGIGITVTLKGGYEAAGWTRDITAHPTIVDANGANNQVITIYPGTNVTVEGFTVQGANNIDGEGGGFFIVGATVVISDTVVRNNSAPSGGGVWVEESVSNVLLVNSSLLTNTASTRGGGGLSASGEPIVTLDNVDVRGNTAQQEAGGLNVHEVTITNSRIVSNTSKWAGGGIVANTAYIYNSEISGNEADGVGELFGGGIFIAGSEPHLVIQDSVVSNNRAVGTLPGNGGGISAGGCEATIVNTIISGNYAEGIAGVEMYHTVFTMTNSLIISNTGYGFAGGLITGTIVNVTVADNTGGGVDVGGAVSIINSVMWGNGVGDYHCRGGCTLAYSDVGSGDSTGTGNISADPKFVDAVNGDYYLSVGSPCIDKGTLVGAPTHDIEGTPRDAAPDMGAYEWTGFRVFLPLTLKNFGS